MVWFRRIQDRLLNLRAELFFVSRITPMKNILFLFAVCSLLSSPFVLDLYGPIRDKAYWDECLALAAELPPNVAFKYKGPVSPDQVPGIISKYDLFVLPTLGENYGHVIAESLSVGTPVLISDTTPWQKSKGGGINVIPIDDPRPWAEFLEEFAALESLEGHRKDALAYYNSNAASSSIVSANIYMFSEALNRRNVFMAPPKSS